MEQLQNLVTQYALGLRRLENEEEAAAEAGNGQHLASGDEKEAVAKAGTVKHLASRIAAAKARSRRVVLRLQHAANRSKWISSTECALFVHTEQQHWTSHHEVPLFISRALYQIYECKRILSGAKTMLTRADTSVGFSVLDFEKAELVGGDGKDEPQGLPNVGNTCFMIALMQCCRQLVARIPPELRPAVSQRCPLAQALQRSTSCSAVDIRNWACWNALPVGPQRDACEILELCFDPSSAMHADCAWDDCYGVIFRNLTAFDVTRHFSCCHCEHTSQETQPDCVLRLEPLANLGASMGAFLRDEPVPDYRCEACGEKGARQQRTVASWPPFLVAHAGKTSAVTAGIAMEPRAHLAGLDFHRFAAVHHWGPSPTQGRYTATVATDDTEYYCDDSRVLERPECAASTWNDCFLMFFQNPSANLGRLCSGIHPAQANEQEGEHEEKEGAEDEERDEQEEGEDDQCTLQAAECRVTSSRHDDWLHRGPYLADLPWQIYMMRVQRVRKPRHPSASYVELFFFDAHYALSTLYCQQVEYSGACAVPRTIGSVCPPQDEDEGEAHAAYKLMLLSRTRCPGPGACADPTVFRSLLLPSDNPDGQQRLAAKPRFLPCWRACKCELEHKAKLAREKEHRAEKIAVIADTTVMKDCCSGVHPASKVAFRLRPHLLQILAGVFDKHTEGMPSGIVELVDLISSFLCGRSCYNQREQLHLAEFAALEAKKLNDALDMDILVRKKPFREDKQANVVNDVDSEDEGDKQDNRIYSEFLGGAGEDDCSEARPCPKKIQMRVIRSIC